MWSLEIFTSYTKNEIIMKYHALIWLTMTPHIGLSIPTKKIQSEAGIFMPLDYILIVPFYLWNHKSQVKDNDVLTHD